MRVDNADSQNKMPGHEGPSKKGMTTCEQAPPAGSVPQ
jgi:hypothetical protein